MERELSAATMLGVVLISLAAIIGLGFGVFQIAKANANTGSADTNFKLAVIKEKEFADYDNTIVMGQYAIEAINNFGKKDMAILIATTAYKDCYTSSGNLLNSSGEELSGVKDAYSVGSNMENFNKYVVKISDGTYKTKNSTITINNGVFINYNTLLGKGTLTTLSSSTNKSITYDATKSKFVCSAGFITVSGDNRSYAKNTVTKNLTRTGMVEYIPVAAKFNSYLIEDMGGAIIGVALDQIS